MKKLGYAFFISLFLIVSCNSQIKPIEPSVFDRSKHNLAYQLLVYSFDDSNGDGWGDFKGIEDRIGYFQELGVTLLYLSPIHKASSYHGYDVLDYYSINPKYGTLDDFKSLVNTAHAKGISVIIDMVLNHSSNRNQWFIDACNNVNDKRDYYIWKKSGISYGTNTIGKFYSSCGGEYFSSFTASMPDFNLSNPKVVEEHKAIVKYWLDVGVDGFRYDAIKHFFDLGEYSTSYDFKSAIDKYMKAINNYIYAYKPNSYIVGEYLESSYSSLIKYAPYIDSEFDFPTRQNIINSINGSLSSLVNQYVTGMNDLKEKNAKWLNSVVISNHDLDRIMSIFANDKEKAALAMTMQMLLPGMPYIYYGDEIGMMGQRYNNNDIERRLPMIWGDTFYRIDADVYGAGNYRKDVNSGVLSVYQQLNDETSLLNYYKKTINFRKEHPEIYRGVMEDFKCNNLNLICYSLNDGNNRSLVIHNVSSRTTSLENNSYNIIFNQEETQLVDNQIYISPYTSIVVKL